MAETVSELLVKIRPDGVSETRDELDEASESFGEMADSAGESVGELEGFSKRWRGAGLVFGAVLGTLTAAIASKMPIIREVAAGMDMILTSLALKIDESVRPAMNDLNEDMADLAQEIDDTDTAAEGLGTALAGAINIALEQLSGRDLSAAATVDFVFEVGAVTFEGLDRGELVDAFSLDFEDILTSALPGVGIFAQIGEELVRAMVGAMGHSLDELLPVARARFEQWITNVRATVDKGVARIVAGFNFGLDIIINQTRKMLNEFARIIEQRVNQAVSHLNRVFGTDLGDISLGRYEVESQAAVTSRYRENLNRRLSSIERRRSGRVQELDRLIAAMQNNDQQTSIEIDGRTVAIATEPHVGRGAVHVGATGVRR